MQPSLIFDRADEKQVPRSGRLEAIMELGLMLGGTTTGEHGVA